LTGTLPRPGLLAKGEKDGPRKESAAKALKVTTKAVKVTTKAVKVIIKIIKIIIMEKS
jgi:hypothetical protein